MEALDTGTVSQQVHDQAQELETNTRLAKTLAINSHGDIIIENDDDSSSDEEETRYLSYVTNDDFEELDKRYFKLEEIANLLASSDLRQRTFALNILLQLITKNLTDKEAFYVFGIILHPDYLQPSIVMRIDQLIRTSASRLDFFNVLLQFLNGFMK